VALADDVVREDGRRPVPGDLAAMVGSIPAYLRSGVLVDSECSRPLAKYTENQRRAVGLWRHVAITRSGLRRSFQ
jgi:hypothetical protein